MKDSQFAILIGTMNALTGASIHDRVLSVFGLVFIIIGLVLQSLENKR